MLLPSLFLSLLTGVLSERVLFYTAFSDPSSLSTDLAGIGEPNTNDGCYCQDLTNFVQGCQFCASGCQMSITFKAAGHYQLYLSISLILVDSWNNEGYYVNIDSQTVISGFFSNVGGSGCVAKNFTNVTVPHNSSFINLTIWNSLANDYKTSSIGFSMVFIYIETCKYVTCQTCLNGTVCDTCIANSVINATGGCECLSGLFVNVDQNCDYSTPCATCTACPASCKSCSDASTCTTCYYNATLNGKGDCVCDDGFYLSSQRNCSIKPCAFCLQCDGSCKTCFGPSKTQCLSCFDFFVVDASGACVRNSTMGVEFRGTNTSFAAQNYTSLDNYWQGVNTRLFSCDITGFTSPASLIGGDSLVFSVDLTGKRPHFNIEINFRMLKVGNWSGQSFQISEKTAGLVLSQQFSFGVSHLCDYISTSVDEELFLNAQFLHQATTLALTIKSTLSSTDKSALFWGIRDFTLNISYCNETCAACSGPLGTQCLSCESNALLNQGTCGCSNGYYANSGRVCNDPSISCEACLACDSTCLTCNGSAATNCLSCFGNAILESNNTCMHCDASCNTCASLNTCGSCYPNAMLNATNQCVCNDGYFMGQNQSCANGQCKYCFSCATGCKTCSGNLGNQCLSCYDTYNLTNGSCLSAGKIEFQNTVRSFSSKNFKQLPSATWQGFSYQVFNCTVNGSIGVSVIGGSDGTYLRYTEDTSSQRPFYQVEVNFTLMAVGNWSGYSIKILENATNPKFSRQITSGTTNLCEVVSGSSDNQLFIDTTINYQGVSLIDFTITSDLPTNSKDIYWGLRDLTIVKYACNETCASCFGVSPNQCISCYQNAVLDTKTGTCRCIDGFFMEMYSSSANAPASVCRKCDSSCLTCTGETADECLTCYDGFNILKNKCVSSDGFIFNVYQSNFDNQELSKWSSVSFGNMTKCINNTRILFGSILSALTFSKSFDLSTFPPHFGIILSFKLEKYEELQNSFLQLFINNKIIDGSFDFVRESLCKDNQNDTNSFKISTFIPIISNNLNITLKTSASPSFFFLLSDFSLQLLRCHESCFSCLGPTSTQCLKCPAFSKKINDACKCNSGFYASKSACNQYNNHSMCMICKICSFPCAECDGPSSKSCLACRKGFTLKGKLCVSSLKLNSTGLLNILQVQEFGSLNSTFFTQSDLEGFYYNFPEVSQKRILQTSSINLNFKMTNILSCPTYFDILGGDTLFSQNSLIVTKIYQNLPPHHTLDFEVVMLKFIANTFIEPITVYLDSVPVLFQDLSNFGDSTETFCVNSSDIILQEEADAIPTSHTFMQVLQTTINHSKPILNLTITCFKSPDSLNESWGFRNIQISFLLCHPSCQTCEGPSSSECLTCTSGYGYTNGTCQTACPNGTYINNVSTFCEACDGACQTCSGSSKNCSSCQKNYLYQGQCVDSCPNDTFLVYNGFLDSWECAGCNPSCLNCQGPLPSDCLSCQNGSYYDASSNLCLTCDTKCRDCKGSSDLDCISCPVGQFLLHGSCFNETPNGYYFNDSTGQLENCSDGCLKCQSDSLCVVCKKGRFLNEMGTCATSCPSGFFSNKTTDVCDSCGSDCLDCDTPSDCLGCKPGFFIVNISCFKKEDLKYSIIEVENPSTFGIYFNQSVVDFFPQINHLFSAEINNYQTSFYQLTIGMSSANSSLVLITVDHHHNFTGAGHVITITINEFAYTDDFGYVLPYHITGSRQDIPLNDFVLCPDNYFLNNEASGCLLKLQPLNSLIYLLETADQTTYRILIKQGSEEIYRNVLRYSKLTIKGYTAQDFSFLLQRNSNSQEEFVVSLKFYSQIPEKTQMTLSLQFPQSFLANLQKTIQIAKQTATVPPYTELDDTDKEILAVSKQINDGAGIAYAGGLLVSLALFPTLGPVTIMMLSSLLINMRYLSVNYPRIMIELFNLKSQGFPLLVFNFNQPDNYFVQVNEKGAEVTDNKYNNDLFSQYNVKLYFVSNFGDKIIQVIAVYFFTLLILVLKKKATCHKYSIKLFDLLSSVFVWSWLLSFFVTNIQKIVLYTVRSWYFAKYDTDLGKTDLAISVIVAVAVIVIFCFLFAINVNIYLRMRRNRIKTLRMTKKINERKSQLKMIEDKKNSEGQQRLAKIQKIETKEDLGSKKLTTHQQMETKDDLLERQRSNNEINKDKCIKTISIDSPALKKNEVEADKNISIDKHVVVADNEVEALEQEKKQVIDELTLLDQRYNVFTKEVKRDSFMTINYIFIQMFQFILYSIILVIFFERPFLQITLLIALDLYFIGYLIVYRPLRSRFKLFLTIFQQIILLYAYILVFILAYWDIANFQDPAPRNKVGRAFGIANWMLFVVFFLGMVKTVYEAIKKKIIDRKKSKTEEKKKN